MRSSPCSVQSRSSRHSIRVFGVPEADGDAIAQALGQALQLTNILRDISEDMARGRIYLQLEDLDRFGYSPEELERTELNPAFILGMTMLMYV